MESTVGGFQAMTNDMLTVLNDIPFSIPPYFALLARAVVTLEGLALSADPSYGLVIEAYPFVARKLLSSDRPELQQALQEVLYAGTTPGGEGMRGVITPTRLAGLINSAAGIVAKQEGQAFVDLDAVPEDGISAGDALAYVLSPAAASLRTLLATEAENAADLLLRQALRKSVPLIAAAVPQPPRLPFLPAPPEPLELPLPLVLPSTPTSSLLSGAGGGVAGFPAALLAGTPTLTTGQQLLDALAPALSRDEELYAISLVDLARSSMGDATADLLAGDLAQDPRAAAAAAIPLLEALIAAAPTDGEAGASGDSSPALVQLARTTVQLLKSLPGVATAGAAAAAAGPAGEGAHEEGMHGALAKLDAQQRATMQHVLGDLGTSLVSKLDERLMAIR